MIRRDHPLPFPRSASRSSFSFSLPFPGRHNRKAGKRQGAQPSRRRWTGTWRASSPRTPAAFRLPPTYVIFAEPDGSAETTREGIGEVVPFLERQTVDSIRAHHTIIDGEWGCELTDYFWSDGPKMPIALCLRVRDGKITEIRPYFDRTLFGE